MSFNYEQFNNKHLRVEEKLLAMDLYHDFIKNWDKIITSENVEKYNDKLNEIPACIYLKIILELKEKNSNLNTLLYLNSENHKKSIPPVKNKAEKTKIATEIEKQLEEMKAINEIYYHKLRKAYVDLINLQEFGEIKNE